jgi:hypothetical protein
VIASAGTLVAMGTSLFLLRQGQQDRREVREEGRREQARKVTVWSDWNPDSPEGGFALPVVPAIYVANASDQAVYEVFVDYRHPVDGNPVRIDVGPVPPGQTRHRDVLVDGVDGAGWEPSLLLPRLYFRDAEGDAWMRDVMGRLRRDPGPGNDGFALAGGRLELGLPRPGRSPRSSQPQA